MAGKLLHIPQRPTSRNDVLGATGDERPPAAVARRAREAEGFIQPVEPNLDGTGRQAGIAFAMDDALTGLKERCGWPSRLPAQPVAPPHLSYALPSRLRPETRPVGKTGLAIRLTEADVPPNFAHVLPLTGSDFRTRLQPAAVAAVFIGAPPDAQDGADAVAAAFGLTPAETRLLASLFAGRTLAETAATLGIAGTTAKTHLEHIFLKTGVTRQAELIRLWTGLISPTGSNG
jgi:DNA-binding CsgD family transcriptional regulator